MKTRAELIESGHVWQVYPDANAEDVRFEGRSRTACIRFLKSTPGGWRDYKRGTLRIGNLIYEP